MSVAETIWFCHSLEKGKVGGSFLVLHSPAKPGPENMPHLFVEFGAFKEVSTGKFGVHPVGSCPHCVLLKAWNGGAQVQKENEMIKTRQQSSNCKKNIEEQKWCGFMWDLHQGCFLVRFLFLVFLCMRFVSVPLIFFIPVLDVTSAFIVLFHELP